MTENLDAPWEPRPAFPQLHALACAMRPDWSPDELRDAMTAAHQAGWEWVAVFREVARLVLAQDESPATLRNSARRPGAPAAAAAPDPRLIAALRAGDFDTAYAATHDGAAPVRRATGPQQKLTEDNDRREAS